MQEGSVFELGGCAGFLACFQPPGEGAPQLSITAGTRQGVLDALKVLRLRAAVEQGGAQAEDAQLQQSETESEQAIALGSLSWAEVAASLQEELAGAERPSDGEAGGEPVLNWEAGEQSSGHEQSAAAAQGLQPSAAAQGNGVQATAHFSSSSTGAAAGAGLVLREFRGISPYSSGVPPLLPVLPTVPAPQPVRFRAEGARLAPPSAPQAGSSAGAAVMLKFQGISSADQFDPQNKSLHITVGTDPAAGPGLAGAARKSPSRIVDHNFPYATYTSHPGLMARLRTCGQSIAAIKRLLRSLRDEDTLAALAGMAEPGEDAATAMEEAEESAPTPQAAMAPWLAAAEVDVEGWAQRGLKRQRSRPVLEQQEQQMATAAPLDRPAGVSLGLPPAAAHAAAHSSGPVLLNHAASSALPAAAHALDPAATLPSTARCLPSAAEPAAQPASTAARAPAAASLPLAARAAVALVGAQLPSHDFLASYLSAFPALPPAFQASHVQAIEALAASPAALAAWLARTASYLQRALQ
eukprot:scaffold12.g8173.t1